MSCHGAHCCRNCGCKYGDKNCPVTEGVEQQEELCPKMYTCTEGGSRPPPQIMLYEILVPTERRKDGKPIRTRYHRVWDKMVRDITGGLTILHPVKGQWVGPDKKLYSERMIPVRIACTEPQIDKIADLTAKYYDQLAVMYYRISEYAVIKEYKS